MHYISFIKSFMQKYLCESGDEEVCVILAPEFMHLMNEN